MAEEIAASGTRATSILQSRWPWLIAGCLLAWCALQVASMTRSSATYDEPPISPSAWGS